MDGRLIMSSERRWWRKSGSLRQHESSSGVVSKHLDSHLRLIVFMSITNLQRSQKGSKKSIS